MAVLLTLNLSCAQPGERHHLNLTTARPFLTLVEIVAAIDFLGVPDGVRDCFLQQPLLLLQMPMPKPSASCAAKFARLLQLALLRQRSAGGPVAAEFLTLVTTSDSTNSDAATNGQRCIRRHWFAAKNPSWRCRTRLRRNNHLARSPAISGSRESVALTSFAIRRSCPRHARREDGELCH